ncbi:MAG: stage V sporulation protein D, partial [Acholeplasmataceae bacterium]|nr:stage V sporulation protein D [Acholeplasmataceae bacterium]
MKVIKKRICYMVYLFIFIFMAIIFRVGYVQVNKGEEYIKRAYELWTRNIPVSTQRGKIYDRNGKLIVGNKLAPTLSIIPKQVKDKTYTINALSTILKVPTAELEPHFQKNVAVEIIKPSGKNIDLETAKKVIAADLPGVYVASDVIRYYPYEKTLAHVLGIVGSDNQGITGLEYIYDDLLMGTPGSQNIYTDAHGNRYPYLTGDYQPAQSGFDLYLTIDIEIQQTLERVLNNADGLYAPEELIGLVMDPQTSEILAMACRPTFDPTNYQDYDQEIFNRNLPIWKSYEPGSTYKIVTFATGIEEKAFQAMEHFYCSGFLVVDGTRIRDWKPAGHGDQTFVQVLQNSCNPGFMTIGLRLGKEKLFRYIADFGFGEKTGVDLLGESTGIIFDIDKIGNVELANAAFGQGNTVTALQLLNATNAAVNGGILNTPYVLKGLGFPGTSTLVFQNKTKFVRRVISQETSLIVADALEQAVAYGTPRGAYIEGYRVGGKTGQAEIPIGGVYVPGKYILSFTGIAPMNNPQISVYLAMNQPKSAIQFAGILMAPMVKEILLDAISVLNIPKQPGQYEREPRWYVDNFFYLVENYVGMSRKSITFHPYYRIRIV